MPPRLFFPSRCVRNLFSRFNVLLLLVSPVLWADTDAADTHNNADMQIEELIVTAQRRGQNLQQVPMSVTALSGEALQLMQAGDLGDIQNAVPNLTLHEGDASNAVVYIRGVGQIDSLSFNDPGVGVYLDDVYLGRTQGAFLDVVDVERIEVLRGPQGTLYGRNTIGGAIKYVSAAPTQAVAMRQEVSMGNYAQSAVKTSLSGALVDNNQVLGKLSVASLTREGFADNAFDGQDDGDKNTWVWRGLLRFLPSDGLRIDLAVDGTQERPDTSRTPARQTDVFTVPANQDPFKADANFNDQSDLDTLGVSLDIVWHLQEQLSLRSISSARRMDYTAHLDLDATSTDIFGVFVDEGQKQLSQELQLNVSTEQLNAVMGLYYFREHDVNENGSFAPAVFSLITNSENDQRINSAALYGQLDYALSATVTVLAGIRYTREKKDFKRVMEVYDPSQIFPPVLGQGSLLVSIDQDDAWSSASPRLGVQLQLQPTLMMYANASRGFKSGGFNGRFKNAFEAQAYDPETLWAYELGVKSDWFNKRLRVNATLFYNDYKDMQLSSFAADENGSFAALFTNAGEARIQGAELELSVLAVQSFQIDMLLGYLDGEYQEFIGEDGADISDQHELVNAPRWTASLSPHYRCLLSNGDALLVQGDISYRSKLYTTVSSSEVLSQSGYSVINAQMIYESADQHWQFSLGGKNLSDKRYKTQGFDVSDSLGYQLAYYGDPRTWTAGVVYQY